MISAQWDKQPWSHAKYLRCFVEHVKRHRLQRTSGVLGVGRANGGRASLLHLGGRNIDLVKPNTCRRVSSFNHTENVSRPMCCCQSHTQMSTLKWARLDQSRNKENFRTLWCLLLQKMYCNWYLGVCAPGSSQLRAFDCRMHMCFISTVCPCFWSWILLF